MEQRRADNIAEALEEHIFSGIFQNGDRLDEVRLAEQFGVSRTPLREALQRLALSGLVELVPRRGAFVRQPGPIELMEMFEVMAELEAVCGRLAARRISDEAIEELRDANTGARWLWRRGIRTDTTRKTNVFTKPSTSSRATVFWSRRQPNCTGV